MLDNRLHNLCHSFITGSKGSSSGTGAIDCSSRISPLLPPSECSGFETSMNEFPSDTQPLVGSYALSSPISRVNVDMLLWAYATDGDSRPFLWLGPKSADDVQTMTLRHWLLNKEVPTFPLPGIYFFDAWRIRPGLEIPAKLSVGLTAVDLRHDEEMPPQPAGQDTSHGDRLQKDHEETKETQGESKRRATGTTRARAQAPTALPPVAAMSHEGSPELPRRVVDKVLGNLQHLPDSWPLMRFDLMLHKSGSFYAIWRRFLHLNEYLRNNLTPDTANATIDAHARGLTEHLVQFLAEWILMALEPARAITKARAPDFLFLHEKDFWFK